jgi:hypothetical protein
LCACAGSRHEPPASLEPTGSAIDGLFGAPAADARRALTAVLRARRVDIELDDATRGIITTGFAVAPAGVDDMACTGGGAWVDQVRYRFRIEIASRGRTLTRLRVYADVQGNVRHADGGAWVDCTSTGQIERDLLDAIQEALNRE